MKHSKNTLLGRLSTQIGAGQLAYTLYSLNRLISPVLCISIPKKPKFILKTFSELTPHTEKDSQSEAPKEKCIEEVLSRLKYSKNIIVPKEKLVNHTEEELKFLPQYVLKCPFSGVLKDFKHNILILNSSNAQDYCTTALLLQKNREYTLVARIKDTYYETKPSPIENILPIFEYLNKNYSYRLNFKTKKAKLSDRSETLVYKNPSLGTIK